MELLKYSEYCIFENLDNIDSNTDDEQSKSKLREHFKKHKNKYIAGAIALGIGITAYITYIYLKKKPTLNTKEETFIKSVESKMDNETKTTINNVKNTPIENIADTSNSINTEKKIKEVKKNTETIKDIKKDLDNNLEKITNTNTTEKNKEILDSNIKKIESARTKINDKINKDSNSNVQNAFHNVFKDSRKDFNKELFDINNNIDSAIDNDVILNNLKKEENELYNNIGKLKKLPNDESKFKVMQKMSDSIFDIAERISNRKQEILNSLKK